MHKMTLEFEGHWLHFQIRRDTPWVLLHDVSDLLGYTSEYLADYVLPVTPTETIEGRVEEETLVSQTGLLMMVAKAPEPDTAARLRAWLHEECFPTLWRECGPLTPQSAARVVMKVKALIAAANSPCGRDGQTYIPEVYAPTSEEAQALEEELAKRDAAMDAPCEPLSAPVSGGEENETVEPPSAPVPPETRAVAIGGTLSVVETARLVREHTGMQIGEKRLMARLRREGLVNKRSVCNLPTKRGIGLALFEVITHTDGKGTTQELRITPQGLRFLIEHYQKEASCS